MNKRIRRGIKGKRNLAIRNTDAVLGGLYENSNENTQITTIALFYTTSPSNPYMG